MIDAPPEIAVRQVVIENQRLRVAILPAVGAGIASLSLRGPEGAWWPLLQPLPPRPSRPDRAQRLPWPGPACFVMAPWPNRVAAAAFTFAGRHLALFPDGPDGSAIHGLVKNRPFRILDRSPFSARFARDHDPADSDADPAWPWPFACRVRYELFDDALACSLIIRNTGPSLMPAGGGFHPAFPRSLWDARDDPVIRAPVLARYPTRAMIPVGPPHPDPLTARLNAGAPLSQLHTDHAPIDEMLLGSLHGSEVHWPASGVRAAFECSPNLDHAVLYIPPASGQAAPAFCLEPMSMVSDGFNALAQGSPGTGVAALLPGEQIALDWTLRVG